MSYLPKFNGNTPLLVVAAIIVIVIVSMTFLTVNGKTSPEVFALIVTAMVTFLTGGALAVESRRKRNGGDESP